MIRNRLIAAAVANWAGQIVSLVTGFFLASFILNRIGDTQYGILVLVGSVIMQGAHLDLGIRSAVIKYVAEHHARGEIDRLRSVVATALCLYVFLGLIALLMTVLISPLLPSLFNVPPSERSTMTSIALLMGSQLAISIPGSTPSAVLAGLQKYALSNAVAVVWTIVSAVATVAVLLGGGGVVGIAAVSLIAALVMQAVMALCVYYVVPDLRFSWRDARREHVRTVLSFSGSMLVMDISDTLQTKTDEIVIGAFLPVSSVSPYSIARRLSSLPQLLAERFLWAFLPLSSQLDAEGESDRLRKLYLAGTRITLAICMPLAAVVTTMAGPLLTLWVGERFAEYAPITIVLALASVLRVSGWPGASILNGLARHHGLAVMSACAALANLGLSIVLVQSYGLIGVAIGTLLPTAVLSFGWNISCAMRILRVTLRELLAQSMLPVLWPSLLMVLFLLGLRWVAEPSGLLSVGCSAATSVALFCVVYLCFFAGHQERQLVRRMVAAFNFRGHGVDK